MQHTAVFEEQIALSPKDMRRRIESIENYIQEKLQGRLEGRCSRHGYVLPGTIKIMSRSMGTLEKGRFTGSILFYVQAEGDVLNPPDGIIIEGEVIRKNKMGMYVSYKDAIRVIVPRDLHIGRDDFEAVEIGEQVKVEIKKSRFQVNDPYILSVGVFIESLGKPSKRAANAAAAQAMPLEGVDEEGEEGKEAEGEAEGEAEEEAEEDEEEDEEGEEEEEEEGAEEEV
jgi:DNA-directed RNA polymerase subunit E'/Rpb7